MKKQKVYAEIYSYGVSDHIVWFDSLDEAEEALEKHIAAMQKVGDYEIFRNEVADNTKMVEGDMSIDIYIPSGDDDICDSNAASVIIRPMKGEN